MKTILLLAVTGFIISITPLSSLALGKQETMTILKVCTPAHDSSLPTYTLAYLPESMENNLLIFAKKGADIRIFLPSNFTALLGDYEDLYFKNSMGGFHPDFNLDKAPSWKYTLIHSLTPSLPTTNGPKEYNCETPK